MSITKNTAIINLHSLEVDNRILEPLHTSWRLDWSGRSSPSTLGPPQTVYTLQIYEHSAVRQRGNAQSRLVTAESNVLNQYSQYRYFHKNPKHFTIQTKIYNKTQTVQLSFFEFCSYLYLFKKQIKIQKKNPPLEAPELVLTSLKELDSRAAR